MTKKTPFVLSLEAYGRAMFFSARMGLPLNQVISEAVLYWWDASGAGIIEAKEDRAEFFTAYFTEHPHASYEDFLRAMEVKSRPN